MKRIAIYGKGGIGKSTISSNLSAAWSAEGRRVLHIGCDPKADSTRLLMRGSEVKPVLDILRENRGGASLDALVQEGAFGTLCIECGGPPPGRGCAGLGISTSMEYLEKLDVFDTYKPDIVLYDVLGDVVCGGFAVPIRRGYAEEVYIVTSGEMMSLYAARNIALAVETYRNRGYAQLGGVIHNSRNVQDEERLIQSFANDVGTTVVAQIPRDESVQRYEHAGITTIEGDPDAAFSKAIKELAETIVSS